MKPNKWCKLKVADDQKEYIALLSHLPLKKHWSIPSVIKNTSIIDKQLRETKGLIGFAFQAEIIKKQFWTLSVWDDRTSLNDFVSKIPHSDVMITLAPHMRQTKFTEWSIKGSDLPPDWNEAKKLSAIMVDGYQLK
ncbi:MAG: hypothetical protein ABI462_05435 [Ignavibacteria bacterium]